MQVWQLHHLIYSFTHTIKGQKTFTTCIHQQLPHQQHQRKYTVYKYRCSCDDCTSSVVHTNKRTQTWIHASTNDAINTTKETIIHCRKNSAKYNTIQIRKPMPLPCYYYYLSPPVEPYPPAVVSAYVQFKQKSSKKLCFLAESRKTSFR